MSKEEIDKVLFPQFLWDIELLKAKHEALEGLFLNFVKELKPDEFEKYGQAYENLYRKIALKKLYELPQIDLILQEKLKRELGL